MLHAKKAPICDGNRPKLATDGDRGALPVPKPGRGAVRESAGEANRDAASAEDVIKAAFRQTDRLKAEGLDRIDHAALEGVWRDLVDRDAAR